MMVSTPKKLSAHLTALLLCTTYFSHAHAVEQELDDLLAMDLENLMEIEVSVASKHNEKLSEAPGIINVITADEIKAYGSRTLFEVLGKLPGVFTRSDDAVGDNIINFRGQQNTNINTRSLLLLNGRPIREGFSGTVSEDFYVGFPLDAIERIEVIRGPGSVLYGTNAYSGVVDIITKKAKKDLHGSASASYGSFNTKQESISAGYTSGDFNSFGAFNAINTDGWWRPIPGVKKLEESAHSAVITSNYKNFTLDMMESFSNIDHFNNNASPRRQFAARKQYINLGYTHNITQNWEVEFNAAYNGFEYNWDGTSIAEENDTLIEISLAGALTDNINLLAGTVHNALRGKNSTIAGTRKSSVQKSAYTQIDYKPIESIKLIAGLQMNDQQGIKKDFSPRLGAIYNFNKHWGTKLLYGQAFRAATTIEKYLNFPGYVGTPTLRPEKIITYDAQIFYNTKHHQAALTFFKSSLRDSIGVVNGVVSNGQTIHSSGFELEGKAKIKQNLNLQGSISYQQNKRDGMADIHNDPPNFMAKLGADYRLTNGINMALFNTHIGEAAIYAAGNVPPPSYNLLTGNIRFDINTLFSIAHMPHTEFSLYGDNLLDDDIRSHQRSASPVDPIAGIPIHSGRAFYGKLAVKF